MGRKTLDSLPNGNPLPNRTNIVLTRDKEFQKKDVIAINSINHLFAYAWLLEILSDLDVYVIGGAELYKQSLDHIDEILVTKINHKFKADAYFPNLDKNDEWEIVDESPNHTDNGYSFKYVTYRRKDK